MIAFYRGSKPKNKFEDVDEEVSEAAVQETLDWLGKPAGKSRLPWRLMLCSRATPIRARFLEHAARNLAWTTRNSRGLVEKACETEVSSMAQRTEKSWAES